MRFPSANYTAGTILSVQNALLSSTLPKIAPQIADNIFNATPFFAWMREKGRLFPWSGGESLEFRLMYGANPYARAYESYEVLDSGPPVGIGNAVYHRIKYRIPITYPADALTANSGPEAVASLADDLRQQAEMSIIDTINTDLFYDYTGNSLAQDTTKINSLYSIVEEAASGSQTQVIGGITKASTTYPWWHNQYRAKAAATSVLTTIRLCYIDCTDGANSPDLGLMDTASYAALEEALQDKRRFTDRRMAEFNFDNIKYRQCTFMFDRAISDDDADAEYDGTTFLLNSKFLKLTIMPSRNFSMYGPNYNEYQDCMLAIIHFAGQLVSNNIRFQGVVKGTAWTSSS